MGFKFGDKQLLIDVCPIISDKRIQEHSKALKINVMQPDQKHMQPH